MNESEPLFGFINIHKPPGMTSHDVVNIVRRKFGIKHVGHGGTLDPLAEGVLPIAVGSACRLIRFLAQKKIYLAGILLGKQTTTDDITGDVMTDADASHLRPADVEAALKKFVGEIDQVPPNFSAIHVDGKRLYELARAGNVTVEVKPRRVQIEKVDLIEESSSLPEIVVRIECSSGTYIRSIARDLGFALGVGGCMTTLIRERSGAFHLSEAILIETLRKDQTVATDCLLDPLRVLQENEALAHCPVDKQTAIDVMHGKILNAQALHLPVHLPGTTQETYVLISHESKLLAVCVLTGNQLKPEVVIANAVTKDR